MKSTKEERSQTKERYGGESFDPANAFRGRYKPETEIDGISCFCVRWGGYSQEYNLPVCMLTKDPQMKTAELSNRPVMT